MEFGKVLAVFFSKTFKNIPFKNSGRYQNVTYGPEILSTHKGPTAQLAEGPLWVLYWLRQDEP